MESSKSDKTPSKFEKPKESMKQTKQQPDELRGFDEALGGKSNKKSSYKPKSGYRDEGSNLINYLLLHSIITSNNSHSSNDYSKEPQSSESEGLLRLYKEFPISNIRPNKEEMPLPNALKMLVNE